MSDGTKIHCIESSTGHIMIDLKQEQNTCLNMEIKSKEIDKLHKQFGHCSAEKLSQLLTSSKSQFNERDIKVTVESCKICKQHGRSRPKPAVSLPLATKTNQTIAIDLQEMIELGPSVWYIHIIDVFSRYSTSTLISNKHADTIIEAVLLKWCLIFGFLKSFLTDNGGEFDNHQFQEFAKKHDNC